MTNREAFATTLAVLAASFNRPLPPEAITGYWLALSDMTEADFGAATKRALRECRFMPTPVELRDLAGKPRESIESDALIAWDAVRRAVDKHDYTASVDFGALVNAVVRNLGGWLHLCDLTLPSLDVWARKEFLRVYGELAPLEPSRLHGEPLAGSLGAAPVRIAIGGKLPPERKPLRLVVSDIVRQLAEAKSDPE